jgi:sterol desaturase/sphingolipid hydroxylase (fatty acid hydroxylase superfamily)
MDKMTTSIIAAAGLLILFILEAIVSKDFRNSFKPSSILRNLSYIASSLVVLILLGEISTIVKFPILDYVGCFLVAELLNWISHYVKHSGRLWKLHYPHHIDKRYTVLLTTQTHAVDVIISGVIIGFIMSSIGFSIGAINTYYLFYTLANTYQHSSLNLSYCLSKIS